MSIKGLDISTFQENVNFAKVARDADDIKFVIIRDGFGNDISQKDSNCDSNATGALDNGLDIGFYHFSYAVDASDAVLEARVVKQIITKYSGKVKYPVFFDWEGDSWKYFKKIKGRSPTKQEINDIICAWCEEMNRGCWHVGIYTNKNYYENYLDMNRLSKYDIWLADYEVEGKPDFPCKMQQYTDKGNCDGITSLGLDMNVCFVDYPTIIKNEGFNGLRTSTPTPAAPTPAPVALKPQTSTTTYTVQSGDTLSGIASKYNTTYQHLAEINNISNPNLINVGQILKISGSAPVSQPSSTGTTYTVKSGDSLWAIASEFLGNGARYNEIKSLNGLSSDIIHPGETLKIPHKQ